MPRENLASIVTKGLQVIDNIFGNSHFDHSSFEPKREDLFKQLSPCYSRSSYMVPKLDFSGRSDEFLKALIDSIVGILDDALQALDDFCSNSVRQADKLHNNLGEVLFLHLAQQNKGTFFTASSSMHSISSIGRGQQELSKNAEAINKVLHSVRREIDDFKREYNCVINQVKTVKLTGGMRS